MKRKIFKTGNSLVVSIPKSALEALNLEEGSDVLLELDPDNHQLILKPEYQAVPGVDEEFARQVSEFIEKYRPALEALAR